jgi:L-rhamnose mutarotase
MRQVFIMRLRPDALPEYRRLHAAVWPELEREIAAAGIERFEIFEADPVLVVSSEVRDAGAWQRLWESDVHRRWGELMEPLLEFGPDGLIDSTEMRQVYRFAVEAGA